MKCANCLRGNPESNYYCDYCGGNLKDLPNSRYTKYGERDKYILYIAVLDDNSKDVGYFSPYKSKKRVASTNEKIKNDN